MHARIFAASVLLLMASTFVQRLSTGVAFMALAWIVAFGGGIRYFCYCAGTAVLTPHKHCHGNEGPVSHAAAGHRHDHQEDHENDDHDNHHHELVKSSTELRLPDVVTAPELKLIPLFWTALSEWESAWNSASVAERPRPKIAEDPPPLSHQVARSVVRLI